jgi:hypothetical protein
MIVNNDPFIKRRFNGREELFIFKVGVLHGWTVVVKMKPSTDCYSEDCCTMASAMINARVINVGVVTTVMYFEIIVADRGHPETHIRIEDCQLQVNKGKPYPSYMIVEDEEDEDDDGKPEIQTYYQAHVFEIADELTGISFDDVVQWENDTNVAKMTIEIARQPQGKV